MWCPTDQLCPARRTSTQYALLAVGIVWYVSLGVLLHQLADPGYSMARPPEAQRTANHGNKYRAANTAETLRPKPVKHLSDDRPVDVIAFSIRNGDRQNVVPGRRETKTTIRTPQSLRMLAAGGERENGGDVRGANDRALPKTLVTDPADVAACRIWKDENTKEPSVGEESDPADFKYVNGARRYLPLWQRKLAKYGSLGVKGEDGTVTEYCLTELLQVRVYDDDKAQWTIRELKQWLHFLFLSGVEHVYVCDHYASRAERLDGPLARYTQLGLLTYIPWGPDVNVTRHAVTAQENCYAEIIARFGNQSRWQMTIDMDEYPFAPGDTSEGFLIRSIQNASHQRGANMSELSMDNFLMLGRGDRSRDLVVDRITRMTPDSPNGLSKPIFRPDRVRLAGVHHNDYNAGRNFQANSTSLRMLHYWGARLQDWGPDQPDLLSKTLRMEAMREHWAERIRDSLLCFGELDAFSSRTGP